MFDTSVRALQHLNELGYGQPGSGLELNLVYNPQGPVLPPPQASLEADYRRFLGERFAVRNSGATAVVEGVGDHGCEYMTGGRVVILGPTGRNFGAGMSGGIAYVWDPDGTFPQLVNDEMVDLDPLDDLDTSWLVTAVFRHQNETGSDVASRILSDWQYSVHQFVKVMPRDYKRVLGAIKAAEEAGQDIDEAIMAAAKG